MISRDRRALIAGGSILLAAILFGRLLPAGLRGWRAGENALVERRALLARERADLNGMMTFGDSAKAIQGAFVALAPRILAGGTDAEAAADLESRVNLAAGGHRTRVVRIDPVPDSAAVVRLRRVRVTVQVESDWSGVVEFLRAVDDDPAALSVHELSLSAGDPTSSSARAEVLHADLEVTGWYLRAEGHP